MRQLTLLILACICCMHSLYSQHASIKGIIADTSEKRPLANSTVMVLRRVDSIMVKFTRTNKDGEFSMKNLPAGDFLILITQPKYADFVDKISLKDSAELDMNRLGLILKSQLLKEVVVYGNKGAIQIKGDTTEFRADSFKVKEGATVEELLKKLPGIQVDKDGKITAQGETVQKVLVDGEEFFGDDPTLVTQNLRADMVDKVQVFDKKSDQATFTGIDDGERTKTINLKLKDDKKNGYFGKLSAGLGTDGYYDYSAMLNYFKKKLKIGFYAIASNTGKIGLNWRESSNYGQSELANLDYDENNGFSWNGGEEDDLDNWNGQFGGQGYPTVKTAGVHFNNKWDEEKESVNANYKILQLDIRGTSATNSQTILPDTSFFTNQTQAFHNTILRNRLDGMYEFKFDSTSSLKITASGGTDHKETDNAFISESRAADSALVNQSTRTTSNTSDIRNLNSTLLWRKRLAKKGRTVSVNFNQKYNNTDSKGFLNSDNNYYIDGQLNQVQVIDQLKDFHSENLLLGTNITYTEPLSTRSTLAANYGLSIDNSTSNRNSLNKGGDGKYTVIDTLYSNDYQFNIFTQRAGLVYNYNKKKLRFNFGSNIGFSNFNQTDVHADTTSKRSFVNWFPQASLTYSFTNQTRLNFRYNGNTKQPDIKDIQPIRTNEDPLNVSIGNPLLKPQFQNNIGIYFNSYKVLTDRFIYSNLNYNTTQNAISNSNFIDSSGRRVYQAINVNGNYNLNAYLGYNIKWKGPDIRIGVNPSLNLNRNANIVNNVNNITLSKTYGMGLSFGKNKDKKYYVWINTDANYTTSNSSIQQNLNTHYWTYSIRGDFDITLPLKFEINSNVEMNFRQKTAVFGNNNNNVILWNGWVGKKFLKNDALLIKAQANDLLNQNIGFNRTVTSNFISQNTYTTIQRFFMLSAVWNFNKAGTPEPSNNNF